MNLFLWISVISALAGIASFLVSIWGPWGPVRRDVALVLSGVFVIAALSLGIYVKRQQDREPSVAALLTLMDRKLDAIAGLITSGAPKDEIAQELRSLRNDIDTEIRPRLTEKNDEIRLGLASLEKRLQELQLRTEAIVRSSLPPQKPPVEMVQAKTLGVPPTPAVHEPPNRLRESGAPPASPSTIVRINSVPVVNVNPPSANPIAEPIAPEPHRSEPVVIAPPASTGPIPVIHSISPQGTLQSGRQSQLWILGERLAPNSKVYLSFAGTTYQVPNVGVNFEGTTRISISANMVSVGTWTVHVVSPDGSQSNRMSFVVPR